MEASYGHHVPNLQLSDFEHRTNELETMHEKGTDLKARFKDFLGLQRELAEKFGQRRPIDPSLP
jgi:hypothetical protein